jgi:gliding motility-associated-like protein
MKGLTYFFFILVLLAGHSGFAQEICDNAKDDDGDGLIDLQDPDCQCHFNVSGNLLQNGSFESFKNCPTNYSYDQDYGIINFWQYATFTSANQAQYYHNFSCSYDSSLVMLFIPPALPLPDGKAFISIRQYVYRKPDMQENDFAKAYVSQCLQNPLIPGEQYTISFSAARFQSNDDREFKFKSEPFSVAIFGNADCNAVPFGSPNAISNGCPANYAGWKLLGKKTIVSQGKWIQNKINFTVPSDINVIVIGPDCSLINPNTDLADSTTFLDFYIYDLDDLHLLPTKDFHFTYIQNQDANPCTADSILNVPNAANASYQWYKDSIAIIGATENSYHLPENNSFGNYNVRITYPDSCLVSETFSVGINELDKLNLPTDTSLCQKDTLLLAPALKDVTYQWNGNSDATVKISQEGTYDITASNASGCSRKFTVHVRSQNCNVYMPNAFTPNGDGKNDLFRIPETVKIILNKFSIFDRWGNKIFNTTERNAGWDGSFKGAASDPGVYIYLVEGMANNKKIQVKGTVTLIR